MTRRRIDLAGELVGLGAGLAAIAVVALAILGVLLLLGCSKRGRPPEAPTPIERCDPDARHHCTPTPGGAQ